jgi:hypothetical protein
VATAPIRYQSEDEDSGRWTGFRFREGDIVISTRSKSGTTWMQMICALLVFREPDLPAPLTELSPWLDWKIRPREQVLAQLDAQQHRRFIKTHTPLDGLPVDRRATYIVVARDPRDMYVSLYHQGSNIDRAAVRTLLGQPAQTHPVTTVERPEVHQALLSWIDRDTSPQEEMDSIRGVLWHLSDAWHRRQELNVVLVHYDGMLHNLDGEMRRLASRLGIEVPEQTWPALVEAATFQHMRERADRLVPTPVLKDMDAFFRQGRSGGWRELLSDEEVAHYEARVAQLAPPDLLDWLHR